MIGALTGDCSKPPRWQLSVSHRYSRSDRHFVGADFQEERRKEGSQVINTLNLVEVGLRYSPNPRWSVSLSVPYMDANRSSALRNSAREIIGRTATQADGLSDITIVGRRWMLDPVKSRNGNLSLGLGIKLPTGDKDAKDWRKRVVNDAVTRTYENVDQSIQPGDGGFGYVLDIQGFVHISQGHAAWYGSGTYLFNPELTDHVETGRRESEKYMSIADQYLVRTGFAFTGRKWRGITFGVGGRWEGVPVHDVFGSSKWFRRPGFGIMVEPWIAWMGKKHSFSVAIPYGVENNREVSVPDDADDRHGDAAFAKYMVLSSWSYRFGGGGKSESE